MTSVNISILELSLRDDNKEFTVGITGHFREHKLAHPVVIKYIKGIHGRR